MTLRAGAASILLVPFIAIAACSGAQGDNSPDAGPEPGKDAGSDAQDSPDAEGLPTPSEDRSRDFLSTDLTIDVQALSGTAAITLAPSASTGASFEAAGLTITGVRDEAGPLLYQVTDKGQLDVGVRADGSPTKVIVDYTFKPHKSFDGLLPGGSTLIWPYHCGNLFPCKSDPRDGLTFTLSVGGLPAGQTAVYPAAIASDAPTYMIAWATGEYTKVDLGMTSAGTKISVWHLPGGAADATKGTAQLRDIFDWYEKTYGPYIFGKEAGGVSVKWGPGAYGGMEHHPFWHVADIAMADASVQAHEAAHGWFGDGVRIACWEDLVLSEGTATYLAARAVTEFVGAAEGQAVWDDYLSRLNKAMAGSVPEIAWPKTCGEVDVLTDGLFSDIPYMKGAFFYRALEAKVGKAALDAALGSFYAKNKGQAAGMQDILDEVKASTGYDPTACADSWLRSAPVPADPGCP